MTQNTPHVKGQTGGGGGGGGGGKTFLVQEFFLSPACLQEFFSPLHEYFFKPQPLAAIIFLVKFPLQEFFLGKIIPPPVIFNGPSLIILYQLCGICKKVK